METFYMSIYYTEYILVMVHYFMKFWIVVVCVCIGSLNKIHFLKMKSNTLLQIY